ncbi:hypothetical protein ACN2EN_05760 [Aliarcobacter lanthieri]|uniref:hypothetical protein n=1 Tax=Aliarcobacter lanthieri TaxID=1355374 RepID=UPI003AFA686E
MLNKFKNIYNSVEEQAKSTYSSTMENILGIYGNSIFLGTHVSGKTTLITWLSSKQLIKEYQPTEIEINSKKLYDISGSEDKVKDWENYIKNKDNIFYLFDLYKFLNKSIYDDSNLNIKYDDLVLNHISFITEHLSKKIKYKKLIVVGTHIDMLTSKQEAQDIVKYIRNQIDCGKAIFINGSLVNEENATKLKESLDKALK